MEQSGWDFIKNARSCYISMEDGRKKLNIFGIRHHSPAGAYYLRNLLDTVNPKLILVEAPSDFTELIPDLTGRKVKPPIAVMAYTTQAPIQSVLYPFAVYSPEYQALLWAQENQCECRFMDLPSGVFLALQELREQREQQRLIKKKTKDGDTEDTMNDSVLPQDNIYTKLGEVSGEDSHETFWEHVLEHAENVTAYQRGANEFGKEIRTLTGQIQADKKQLSEMEAYEIQETILREAYMHRQIADAIQAGLQENEIVVVTGAYHVEGLLDSTQPMSDEEIKHLPTLPSKHTLMPYSYYRLSEHSGYGAGNRAPAYYELLWDSLVKKSPEYAVHAYLSQIAAFQRKNGNPVSTAEVIEAVQLAASLSMLHGYHIPALRDLRDAAVTCMGYGSFSAIALAVADTEIGTKIGALPEGVSQTSVQADFYQKLEELRLTKYKSVIAEELQLDLREKLSVKSKKSAFLDLERSFFLHKLRVLQIQFATYQMVSQDRATWAEKWVLCWTPEAEIQIVEAVLKGDTIEQAASFVLKEMVEQGQTIAAAAKVIEDALVCGMSDSVRYATRMLQEMAVDAASVIELADTAKSLSTAILYGDIRHLETDSLLPILSQLFLRACLIFADSCVCDDGASKGIAEAMEKINAVVLNHEILDEARWIRVLLDIAGRDDLNTKLSGFAAAILLERGQMDNEELGREVERRLSKGIPAQLGAGWFEGLAMKNHYALIARMMLWEKLSDYLDTLSDEEFKRALLFLRRAFADFSSAEKHDIAENLGEIWQVNPQQVSEVLNIELDEEQAQELFADLDEFDFDDI